MRQCITEKSHAAQHNKSTDHRAHRAHQNGGDQSTLHKPIGERLNNPRPDGGDHSSPPSQQE
ncbi:MAG: hypothetical protein ACD_34C00195G0002 [uncultured bacterium]|nr:MAG: hypothetical protein ACD_34C00195G0002 [uncultured bacterium]